MKITVSCDNFYFTYLGASMTNGYIREPNRQSLSLTSDKILQEYRVREED